MKYKCSSLHLIMTFCIALFFNCNYMNPFAGFENEEYDIKKQLSQDNIQLIVIDSLDTMITIQKNSSKAFKFIVDKDKMYFFRTSSSGGGSCIRYKILDSVYDYISSVSVGYSSDPGFSKVLSAGIYYLVFQNSCSNLYSTNLTIMNDRYEPDNTRARARTIGINSGTVNGILNYSDRDMFVFEGVKDSCYKFKVKGIYSSNIVLCRPDSTTIASSSGYDSVALSWRCKSSGTYYIMLSNNNYYNNGIETYKYTFMLESIPVAADQYEPDDSIYQAHILPADGKTQQHTNYFNDIDWIKMVLMEGYVYKVKVQGYTGGINICSQDKTILRSSTTSDSFYVWGSLQADSVLYLKTGTEEVNSTYAASFLSNIYTVSMTPQPIDNNGFDNFPQSAKMVRMDSLVYRGSLLTSDIDWIKFPVKAGNIYQVRSSGETSFNLTLNKSKDFSVITSGTSGQRLSYKSITDDTLYVKIGERAGTHYNFISAYQTLKLLNYTIIINDISNDAFEPDDSIALAKSITSSGVEQMRIYADGEEDYFKFDALKDSSYQIRVSKMHRITLYNDSGSIIRTRSTPSIQAEGLVLQWMCSRTGTYYFNVKNLSMGDSSIIHYTASVSLLKNDAFEPDDSIATAKDLTLNGPAQSRVLISNEKDFIKINAVKDSSYSITVSNLPKVSIVNDSGAILYTQMLTTGTTTANSIKWLCPRTGAYYVRIDSVFHSIDSLSVNYSISLTTYSGDKYEPDNTIENASVLGIDSLAQQHNLLVMDVDWVKFSGKTGAIYQINYQQLLSNQNLSMSLYLDSGKTLFQTKMVSGTNWNCPANGDYFLKFWVDAKSFINNTNRSDCSYYVEIKKIQSGNMSKEEVLKNAILAYPQKNQDVNVKRADQSWLKINMNADSLYQTVIQSTYPVNCYLFNSGLSTEILPVKTITRTISNKIVQVFLWDLAKSDTGFLKIINTNMSDVPVSVEFVPYVDDTLEPDSVMSQIDFISTNGAVVKRAVSIHDTIDAMMFHGIDGKNYTIQIRGDSVTFNAYNSFSGAKLSIIQQSSGISSSFMKVTCKGSGDFVVTVSPLRFTTRILSYEFSIKEE